MGFSMKSSAPAFSALRADAASPCAVTMTIGQRNSRAASSACTSAPLMPGIRRSSSTIALRSAGSSSARNASPDANDFDE